jgi:probable rRNA maturation factor
VLIGLSALAASEGVARVMAICVEMQYAWSGSGLPPSERFRQWVVATLRGLREDADVLIRIVGEVESARLNASYRGRSGATNVLSFPFEPPPPVATEHLGDLVICAPVVAREAVAQDKPMQAHWAHMVVHGVLHLLGYDHQDESTSDAMESLEIEILDRLGYSNPYLLRPAAQDP